MSRTSKSVRNVIFAILGQLAMAAIGFIGRKIFVVFLNAEYLGLNGLFSSILTVLSLAELGIGPAMIFSLYKPIAEKNIAVCQALMKVYQKAYRIIGFTVLIIGCCITPFITFFINEIPEAISGLHIIYIMFVINAAISYFFSYKRSLLIANQDQYQINCIHTLSNLVMNVMQIMILALTKNYFLFLLIQISFTLIENLILSMQVDKIYPWLKEKSSLKEMPPEIRMEVERNVKAMIFHRIGGIAVDSSDRLLISKFFGLLFLGIYSNYLLIIDQLLAVIQLFFTSITASIGNFGVEKSPEDAFDLFNKIYFINFWLAFFCTISFYTLATPFISSIWLGEQYLMSKKILVVISINFYIKSMRKTVLTFKEAFGLPWYDRYKPLISAVVNLVLSLFLAKRYGVIGIFLGTTITDLCVNVWFETYVVFKYCFRKSIYIYLKKYIKQLVFLIVCAAAIDSLSYLLPLSSDLGFWISAIICFFIPNIVIIIIYRKTAEFAYIKGLVQSGYSKIIRR